MTFKKFKITIMVYTFLVEMPLADINISLTQLTPTLRALRDRLHIGLLPSPVFFLGLKTTPRVVVRPLAPVVHNIHMTNNATLLTAPLTIKLFHPLGIFPLTHGLLGRSRRDRHSFLLNCR
jgi:hypothetical protein